MFNLYTRANGESCCASEDMSFVNSSRKYDSGYKNVRGNREYIIYSVLKKSYG